MQFLPAAVVLILLYGCTTWTLTERMKKKFDGNCARMLWAILYKFWKQHATKQLLYRYLLPISKTIQRRPTIHAVHCWRRKDELINDILLWTPLRGHASVGRPIRTYLQQLSIEENNPEAMDNKDEWKERVKENPRLQADLIKIMIPSFICHF